MKQQEKAAKKQTEQVLLQSPVGMLCVEARDGAVRSIRLARAEDRLIEAAASPLLTQAVKELSEYFAGTRTNFTFPMYAEGTPFQKSVWDALSAIPFGETRTYGEIARQVQNEKGSRAVGMACNRNPIMIAVPCHRVVGAKGALTGYAYGTDMKQQLLDLEQKK